MRWLAAVLVTLLGAAGAEARVVTESDSAGGMTAEFSYDRAGDEFNQTYRDLTLRIYEGDGLVFRDEVACGRRCSPARASGNVVLRDLDGGDPEVVIDLYTGGAYCCWKTVVYRATTNSYVSSEKSWGPKRRRLMNLGGGSPEFISHDDSFLRPYGCAACWRYLPLVWRFDGGRFREVTGRFPGQVKPGSRKLRRKYFRASRGDGDVKPWLAAYVATAYLLGKPDTGWDLVRRALRRGELDNRRGRYDFCPCGDRYPKRLRRHLRENGYR